jgi:Cu/Ag efflux protein CusF
MGEKAPAGMNSIAQGEITDIDRTQNKVTVKDSRTGSSIRYTINDQKELKDLNQGDRVQIFSEANQAK